MSHQWGAMDRSQLTQSKNPTSPTVSVRIHRRITRQHPRLHQNPHHKNSTPNISTRCKRNSYITSIPIDFVPPKLLNYLAFQSFDLELPDEGYSMCTTFLLPLFSNVAIWMFSLKTRYTHCERGLTSCLHLIYLSLYCSSLEWCIQPLESRLPDAGTR